MGRTKEFDREQVLRKAMIVFWEKGYEGASIPDLLQSMGISRSSMYETFQDKQTLYYEAIQQYKKMSQKKRDLMIHAPSAITGIRQYFELHITNAFATHGEAYPHGCLITNASVGLDAMDEPLQNTIRQSFTELEQLFYEKLKEGQETGEISPHKDIKMLSFLLLNLNHSINVMARIQSDSEKVRGMMNAVIESL
ncbi:MULTISPECIES: TetR/AcrR family transcriptional regulator [Paenibacillus]|uniref:TetR/AcrR family transcriptional repressor of nem operon n=1 Tax=Paenibacillus lactis TaxID=228574 RepID=A0ABS4FCQ3_9BACL|nr:TetR/AcrR family transcriptional regulator [Paenibacillus lactis]MBP1894034.1 TetR/AcrR family transcriptional repressor of nem operon [Paenibacillus lactis]